MVWTGGDPATRRRGFLAGAVAGRRGGLPGRRGDQEYAPPVSPAAPGSRSNVFKRIIVTGSGPGSGLFVYSGAPKLGNPPILAVVAPGTTTDPFGNPVNAVLNIGDLSHAHSGFDAAGRMYFVDSGANIRIFIDPGVGSEDTRIEFRNAFGAIVFSIDPTAGGLYSYADSGSATQGLLNASLVSKTGNDPVTGKPAGGALNLYGSTFLTGGLINFDPDSAHFPNFSTNIITGGIQLNLGQNVAGTCTFQLGLPLTQAIVPVHPGSTATAETWQTPSVLGTGFATGSSTAGFQPIRYRLTVENEVEIAGIVHSTAAVAAGATIFTLAAGYIPSVSQRFSVAVNNNAGAALASFVSVASGTGVVSLTLPALAGASEDVYIYVRFPLS